MNTTAMVTEQATNGVTDKNTEQNNNAEKNILLVDLNNEAPFPTLAIGYLSTPLKAAGYNVDVFAPLAYVNKILPRDVQETWKNYAVQRIRFAAHPLIEWANGLIYDTVSKYRFRPTKEFKQAVDANIVKGKVDAVLVSAYLQYRDMAAVICASLAETSTR